MSFLQLVEALGGVLGDACEDIGEPGLRVDIVHLASLREPRLEEFPVGGAIN